MRKRRNFFPETKKLGDTVYCKIQVNSLLYDNGKASKFLLKANTFVNGYKVKAGTEIYIPDHLWHHNNCTSEYQNRSEKYIWVNKKHYETLIFI